MKQRMNLFKQLIEDSRKSAKAASSARAASFKLGFHGYFAIVIVGIFLLGIGLTYSSYHTDIKTTRSALQQARSELNAVMAQSDSISSEMAKLKAEKAAVREAAGKAGGDSEPSSEDNWTSFLWRFSSLTNSGILISTMQLTRPQTPGTTQLGREVVLVGRAKSLVVIRDWLERVSRAIPDYDFALDSQEQGDNQRYPVSFRVTARLI